MAIAVQSVGTTTWSGRQAADPDPDDRIAITKPTGLADGDLMVAHISNTSDDATIGTYNTPTGWTLGTTVETVNAAKTARATVFYKVADSTDAAASDFEFELASDVNWCCGAMYRIDGHGDVTQITLASDEIDADTTPSYVNTITPTQANSLILIMSTAVGSHASGSASTYAIATNNPTWAEGYDIYGDSTAFFGAGDGDGLMVGAYAVRPEVTATGNSSLTFASFDDSACILMAIPPVTNVTVAVDLATLTGAPKEPAITGDANVSVDLATITTAPKEPTITTVDLGDDGTVSSPDKSSAPTWLNPDKS